ncbi:MAG: DUF2066 domain-containing protein [Alphaproteobacteria bacterium]|nr:DUF2066 domain-containing protein [Alphaproteobacteria bacterium]
MHKFINLFLAAILVLNFVIYDASAQAVYQIDDVIIDKTAKDVATARQQGINSAQIEAFNVLLSRILIDPAQKQNLLVLSPVEINGLIADYEVISEKSSTTRYIANVSFRFRPESVRKLLRENGIDYVEAVKDRTLILPVLALGEQDVLFRDDNLWLKNWQNIPRKFSFTSPVLPIGDIDDVGTTALDDGKINLSIETYNYFVDRYKTQDILLIKLYQQDEQTDTSKIDIFRIDRSDASLVLLDELNFPLSSKSYNQLIIEILNYLESKWKEDHVVNVGTIKNIIFVIRFNGQNIWYDVQDKLRKIQFIENFNITRINPKFVEIQAQINTNFEKLSAALTAHGFNIQEIKQDVYQIIIP